MTTAAGNCPSKPHKGDPSRRNSQHCAAAREPQRSDGITCASDQSQVSCTQPLRNAALEVIVANIHELQIWEHIHAAAVLQPARALSE